VESLKPEIDAVMHNLEEVFGVTSLRENVSALLDEALAELDSWDGRKKAAIRALNAEYAEERDALRERLRLVLIQYAEDLTDRLQLGREEAAVRMYFEFPHVPATVVGGVFGLHQNKVVHLASTHRWPVGGECRSCHEPYTTGDRASLLRPWVSPPFCSACQPRCRECDSRFDLEHESDEILDRLAAGERFRCVSCADREDCDVAIQQVEALAGEALFDTSRQRAHQLYGLSKEDFWDALNDTVESYEPDRDDSNACALFTYKIDNRLQQLGVHIRTPKRRSQPRTSSRRSGRAWDGSYDEYLLSDRWRSKRQWALERADHRCQLCGAGRDDRTLHVHHNNYDNLGAELPPDLIVLCDGCHYTFHDRRRVT
jgi:hypothetical protein